MMSTEASSNPDQTATAPLLRRVGWRILPLLLLLYFVAYLDRINISFAAASMQRDLHFSDSLYGTGAGLFFLGALLAQLPSNLVLYRFGARRTIAALMVVWGCVSGAMAFIHTPAAFLVLRFLLGAAEAGFYPGVILYLTLWLPRRVRTGFIAWFLFAIPMASIFGGPLSSWVLAHGHASHGVFSRFADWQLLLLTEALPALLFGSLLPFVMTDTPQQARWLTDRERALLAAARIADEPPAPAATNTRALDIGSLRHLLLFAAIYFAMQFGLYAQSFWLPQILGGLGVATAAIGWHVSLIYLGSAIIMLAWGAVTDRAPTLRWTLGAPLLLAAFGYAATTLTARMPHGTLALIVAMTAFGLGSAGALAATPPFWAQVTLGQRVSAIAAMIALINALGNLGGFAGPSALGWLHQHTGGYATGMVAAGAALALSAALFYAAHPEPAPHR